MSNPKITTEYSNTQLTLPLEVKEENSVKKEKVLPKFKPYNNKQSFFIHNLEELIPEHHVARVVDDMVESIPDEQLFVHYSGGGRPPFHPKLMLKVILYAYSQKVYSCRDIAIFIQENLPAMWLAAMQKPDFRTINDFRGKRMKAMMDELFETMILKLIDDGHITMENYFLDGTKIEANANKYSFVWKKSTLRFEEKLKAKIKETLQHIHEVTEEEAIELEEMLAEEETTPEQLEQVADQLEEQVNTLTEEIEKTEEVSIRKKQRAKHSQLKKPLKLIRDDFLPRLRKYSEYKDILGERNSFSKTDPDATFMRMKDDHMKNGQLKPGYNVQMATENQFILYYTIHQRPTDTRCFIPHFEKLAASRLPIPKTVIADAGYGSEENYLYAVGEDKEPRLNFIIPYGTYIKEQTRKYKNEIKNAKNWTYLEHDDQFICPNGRSVVFKTYRTRKNASGWKQDYKIYECEDCSDCPLKPQCTKAKRNRQVHWNPVFEEMKAKAKKALECEENAEIYARRKIEVESVFGHIKGNRSFRRFSLRGLEKVHVEFGIVALAHNLLKVAGIRQLFSGDSPKNTKPGGRKQIMVSFHLNFYRGFLDSPFLNIV